MTAIGFADIKDTISATIMAECEKVYKEIEPHYEAAKAAHEANPDDKDLLRVWVKLEGALLNLGDAQRSCEQAIKKLEIAWA